MACFADQDRCNREWRRVGLCGREPYGHIGAIPCNVVRYFRSVQDAAVASLHVTPREAGCLIWHLCVASPWGKAAVWPARASDGPVKSMGAEGRACAALGGEGANRGGGGERR